MDLAGPTFAKARYWTEWDAQGERLVMPMQKGWKVVRDALFVFAIGALQHVAGLNGDHGLFDYLVAIALALSFAHLLLSIFTSLLAREVVRIEAGDLVHGWWLLGLRREKRYPLREIYGLSAEREIAPPKDGQLISPLKDFGKVGAVNFDFNGKTFGIGATLDQSHGQQVVDWIARRAPRSVFDFL